MAKKNGFGAGLVLGVAAGFAAKYLFDNKDEVKTVIDEKTKCVREGVSDLAGMAKEKLGPAAESITKAAGEYVNYAKEQFEEIKNTLTAEVTGEEPACECAQEAEEVTEEE